MAGLWRSVARGQWSVASHGARFVSAVALVVTVAAQAPPQFDVASIKRNTSGRPQQGPPGSAANGQFVYNGMPVAVILPRAFTGLTTPITVEGLPDWTHSERWDFNVRFRPGATLAEQTEMWRALFTDRMKLQAHVDTRPRVAYRLVLARPDRRLGPQLHASFSDCPPPDPARPVSGASEIRAIAARVLADRRAPTPQEEAFVMSQCGGPVLIGTRLYGGVVEMAALARMLPALGGLEGEVADQTGLTGTYAVALWAGRSATAPTAAPAADDAPDIFSAVRDQLGLKLERTTIDGRVLVVDHIERPTEN